MDLSTSRIIRIPIDSLERDPIYAAWKVRADLGEACDYQQAWFTGTGYRDICLAEPVIRWEGERDGRSIRTSYCAGCAPTQSPPATWDTPVTLTVLPGCPVWLRRAAEMRARVILTRVARCPTCQQPWPEEDA